MQEQLRLKNDTSEQGRQLRDRPAEQDPLNILRKMACLPSCLGTSHAELYRCRRHLAGLIIWPLAKREFRGFVLSSNTNSCLTN